MRATASAERWGAQEGVRPRHPDGDVAAHLFAGLRRYLVEEGRWEAARERVVARDPRANEWIDASVPPDWVKVEHHLALMQALLELQGVAGLREFGRRRTQHALESGALSPILRGWMRSYASAPEHFVRVTPHVWAASTRNLGRLSLVERTPGAFRFRSEGLPSTVLQATAWHRFLEGFGEGLLLAADREGSVVISQSSVVAGEIECTYRW